MVRSVILLLLLSSGRRDINWAQYFKGSHREASNLHYLIVIIWCTVIKVVAATLNGVSHEPAQSMASGDLAAVPPPQIA